MASRSHLSLDVGTQLAFQTTEALGEMRRALTDLPHEVLLQSELMKKINKLVGDIVDTRLDPETVSTLCNEVKRLSEKHTKRIHIHERSLSFRSVNPVFVAKARHNASQMETILTQMQATVATFRQNTLPPWTPDALWESSDVRTNAGGASDGHLARGV